MNRQQLVTYVVFTLHMVAFFIQLTDLPFVAKRFGVSDATFGMAQTSFGVLQILGGPVFSILINKFGLKICLHINNLMTIAMCCILILFNNSFGLFASRLAGFLMQALQVHKSLLAELTTPGEQRTNAFGLMGLCSGISLVIAPLVNSFASFYSESAPLYVAVLLSVTAVCLTQVFVHETEVNTAKEAEKTDFKKAENGFNMDAVKRLSSRENVLSLFLQKQNSVILMVVGICLMLVSAVGLPKMRKRFTEPQLITFATVAFLLVCLQFTHFVHLFQLVIILPGFTFAMGVMNPVSESMLSSAVDPSEQALMLGLSTTAFTVLQAVAPGLAGFLLQSYGFHVIGVIGVLGSLSSLAVGHLLPIKEQKSKSS